MNKYGNADLIYKPSFTVLVNIFPFTGYVIREKFIAKMEVTLEANNVQNDGGNV